MHTQYKSTARDPIRLLKSSLDLIAGHLLVQLNEQPQEVQITLRVAASIPSWVSGGNVMHNGKDSLRPYRQ
jgi:hypothetical protein